MVTTLLTDGASFGDGEQMGGVTGEIDGVGDGDQYRLLTERGDGESTRQLVINNERDGNGEHAIYYGPILVGLIAEDHTTLQASLMTVVLNIRTYRR